MFGIEANKARTRSWGDRLVPIGHRKDTGEAGLGQFSRELGCRQAEGLTPTGARFDALWCVLVRAPRIQTASSEPDDYGFEARLPLHL